MSRAKRKLTGKEKKVLMNEVKQIVIKRKEKGMTQATFAKAMGRSPSNIANVESGQILPNEKWLSIAKSALNLEKQPKASISATEKKQKSRKTYKKILTTSERKEGNKITMIANALISAIAETLLKKECK